MEAPDELTLVPFDAIALEQVLVNLLDNALLHTPAGSPIEIRCACDEGGAFMEVLDRGPGLPPGAGPRVFEKFFRARPAGEGAGPRGIGLGLAICRGIIDAHGGRITAENRPGGGAAFRLTLPAEGAPPVVDAGDAVERVGP